MLSLHHVARAGSSPNSDTSSVVNQWPHSKLLALHDPLPGRIYGDPLPTAPKLGWEHLAVDGHREIRWGPLVLRAHKDHLLPRHGVLRERVMFVLIMRLSVAAAVVRGQSTGTYGFRVQ